MSFYSISNPIKTTHMRRARRRLFNLFAFSLLAFAIYLNFFYKESQPGLLQSQPPKKSTAATSQKSTAQPAPAAKNNH
jgi:hypothetical protein